MKQAKNYLIYEFIALFCAFPLTIAYLRPHGWIYITLWVVALFCVLWMRRNHYNFKADWNRPVISRTVLKAIFFQLLPASIALAIFTYVMIPDRMFSLPLHRPQLWVMVMILYPLLSVIPQEIIYRSFFFRRYAPLFTTPKAMIIASALAFGWVHIVLLNWVAVVFSAIGGFIFASTYSKTRSLGAVCLEHALYGCMLFTLGLGYYFYHGQAVR
jgi:membrane protease YdiL (CAAX protease family)